MAIHYAPRTPAYRIDRDRIPAHPVGGRYRADHDRPARRPLARTDPRPTTSTSDRSPSTASHELYRVLHAWTRPRPRLPRSIVPPPDEPEWRAIRDRIWRATTPWPGP